jgi:hypothetical protein
MLVRRRARSVRGVAISLPGGLHPVEVTDGPMPAPLADIDSDEFDQAA